MRSDDRLLVFAISCIVALLALAVWLASEYAAGRNPIGCYYTHQQQRQATGNQNQGVAPGSGATTLNYQSRCEKPKDEKEADFCQQRRMADAAEYANCLAVWQLWVSIIGIGGLIATISYSAIAARAATASATSAQANATTAFQAARAGAEAVRVTHTSEQAHVYIDPDGEHLMATIQDRSVNFSDARDDQAIGERPKVLLKLINRGKTPATLVDFRCVLTPSELADEPDYAAIKAVWMTPEVLSAGQRSDPHMAYPDRKMTFGDCRAIGGGQRAIWFYGRVTWLDIYQVEHSRGFLWQYSGDGFRPDYRPAYNRVT